MQELIDAHSHQHSAYVVIAPQVNYMPALNSPSETPSPSSSSWMSLSPNLCSTHINSYQPQFMTETTTTYPFSSHMTSNSLQKPSIANNYFQSEPESMSNQSEPQTRATTLLNNNKSSPKKKWVISDKISNLSLKASISYEKKIKAFQKKKIFLSQKLLKAFQRNYS